MTLSLKTLRSVGKDSLRDFEANYTDQGIVEAVNASLDDDATYHVWSVSLDGRLNAPSGSYGSLTLSSGRSKLGLKWRTATGFISLIYANVAVILLKYDAESLTCLHIRFYHELNSPIATFYQSTRLTTKSKPPTLREVTDTCLD